MSHGTTGSSVNSISRVNFEVKCHWLVHLFFSKILFYFFHGNCNIFLTLLLIFSNSNVLTVVIDWCFFSSINWNQIGVQSHMWKLRSNSCHKWSFWVTWPLLSLFIYFQFRINRTTLYIYLWYPFLCITFITSYISTFISAFVGNN